MAASTAAAFSTVAGGSCGEQRAGLGEELCGERGAGPNFVGHALLLAGRHTATVSAWWLRWSIRLEHPWARYRGATRDHRLATGSVLQGQDLRGRADVPAIRKAAHDPLIAGFTTNPTLMRKAGVDDYEQFAREALEAVPDKPISFEVFADDADAMDRQAHLIASWAPNVFVKIPITYTDGQTTDPLVRSLVSDGVQVNVTAMLTVEQVVAAVDALAAVDRLCVGVRRPHRRHRPRSGADHDGALAIVRSRPGAELIWASPPRGPQRGAGRCHRV